MLNDFDVETELAAAGFVLFRDLDAKDQRFEIANPMPLAEATKWLRRRSRSMIGGDDPAEPVLDAVTLAQKRFHWNGGTATRNAKRVVLLVANKDAKPETVGLTSDVTVGLDASEVASRLRRSRIPISVFSLQAGADARANLVAVLSTLARETGGEFYDSERGSDSISSDFSLKLERLLTERMDERSSEREGVREGIKRREGGGTIIVLGVLDEDTKQRLQAAAAEFKISAGGLLVRKAWLFEDPGLYREEVLVEKDLLETLVRHFNDMADSAFDSKQLQDSTAKLLEALTGENVATDVEVQELIEKRLGLHFTTNFLSYELDQLSTLGPEERLALEEKIRNATSAIAGFIERNARRFDRQHRLWMPLSLLP